MSIFDDPGFRLAVADVEATKSAALSTLQADRTALAVEFEQFRKEKAGRDKERAAAARRGEFGPERQQLQRRIDAGETTWADVRSGRDTHPSAAAVRGFIDRNLDELAARMRNDPELEQDRQDLGALLGAEPTWPDEDDGS